MYKENEERDQSRVDLGNVLLGPNRKVYEHLALQVRGKTVLEAGCGNGVGSYLLSDMSHFVHATDKLEENVVFSRSLYPDKKEISFGIWDIGKGPFKEKYEVVVAVEVIEHVKKYRQAIQNLIQSAIHDVWISTPNRDGLDNKESPQQEFHVKEFTVEEMLEMIGKYEVEIYHWETFEKLDINTKVHPLIYHIIL